MKATILMKTTKHRKKNKKKTKLELEEPKVQ